MTKWNIARTHVSAQELGTAAPWIPEKLVVEAAYFNIESDFTYFKNTDHKNVMVIRSEFIREIWDDSATFKGRI